MKDLITDAESLLGQSTLSGPDGRRGFLKVALGTGFAVAVMPVVAQNVIKTDSVGLVSGTITVKVDGQDIPVYVAQPDGKTGLPVVLVISEIFGVHEHIADMARRFAKECYLALAPDLFVRHGDATKVASIPELMKNIVGKTPDAQVMKDLDAVVAWAKQNGGDTTRLGITGFCWGGRVTWMYAAHNPQVKAGVAWYGRLVGEATPITPQHPVDITASLTVPVLGLYGGKDTGIPLDTIAKMKTALAKGTSRSEFVVYDDAGHAFNADYRPSYVAADAKDGYARCLAWFKQHGVAS